MSKLYEKFEKLKKDNPNKLYLFKSGIFYLTLNEDAKMLSDLFDFRITNLTETVTKCGFPEKRIDYYANLLKNCNIDFEIVSANSTTVEPKNDYLRNEKIKSIITSIQKLDMNKITFQKAFDFLHKINIELNNID